MSTLTQVNGGQFRVYRYDPGDGSEPTDLLSVTSIRSLCGEPFNLVAWKMANLADAALGTQKRTVIGPRGGVSEKRQVFEFPSEFARLYTESNGEQAKIDDLRKWLREAADEPRNVAARRGTMVHAAIERNVAWDRIERPWVEAEFATLSHRDRKAAKAGVTDEDVNFIRNSVRQYTAMRSAIPMVLIAREVRVVNLTVGYAGTFDALAWILGTFNEAGEFTPLPEDKVRAARGIRPERVTLADIRRIGGTLAMLDWKTSNDLHTDNMVQCHAYLAAEFACIGDERDERVTALVTGATLGGLAHIRPDGWELAVFPFQPEVVRAFLGSVAFARFLAKYPAPAEMFLGLFRGESEEVDE